MQTRVCRCVLMFVLNMVVGFVVPFAVLAQTQDAPVAWSFASDDAASPAPSAEPAPAEPSSPPQEEAQGGGKLNATVGNVKFGFYGTLLLNISASDNPVLGGDVPLWSVPGSGVVTFPDGTSGHIHDLFITARQTVLGVRISPAMAVKGWSPEAVVEFDFFGTRPADTTLPAGRVFDQPRLRRAFFALTRGNWRIVAGQDDIIISPLNPISLSHVAVPLGATAGNLWGWLPQVRLDKTQKITEKTSALFQFGALRPEFADPRLGDAAPSGVSVDNSTAGTRSTMPFLQARVAISHPMNGTMATIGVGGHYGREVVGAGQTLDSWAQTLDLRIPVLSRVIFRGEGYVGSNLIPFEGGIDQGVSAIPASTPFKQINKVGDTGGWGELTFRITSDDKNHAYIGGGMDEPVRHTLLVGSSRERNAFYWASYFYKITKDVTAAWEWSNWQFATTGFNGNTPGPRGARGRANVFNLALAYSF